MKFYREGGFVEVDVPEDIRTKIRQLVDSHVSIYTALSASIRALHTFGESTIRSKEGAAPTYSCCGIQAISTADINLHEILAELCEILGDGWFYTDGDQPAFANLLNVPRCGRFTVSLTPPCSGSPDVTILVLNGGSIDDEIPSEANASG